MKAKTWFVDPWLFENEFLFAFADIEWETLENDFDVMAATVFGDDRVVIIDKSPQIFRVYAHVYTNNTANIETLLEKFNRISINCNVWSQVDIATLDYAHLACRIGNN